MKIPLQEKIAELEQRIVALEKQVSQPRGVTQQTTIRRVRVHGELDKIWKSVDDLFAKVFG